METSFIEGKRRTMPSVAFDHRLEEQFNDGGFLRPEFQCRQFDAGYLVPATVDPGERSY